MNKLAFKIYLLLLGTTVFMNISAQEVITSYNLIDESGAITASTLNETVPYLTDKNENTAFTVPAGKNSWIQFENQS